MRTLMIGILGVVVALSAIAAQEPTCRNCPGTYIPGSEVQAYAKRAIQYGLVDQQTRWSVQWGSLAGTRIIPSP